jgi:hypothetical protein
MDLTHAILRPRSLSARTPFVAYATVFDVGLELRASSQHLLDRLTENLPHLAQSVALRPEGARAYSLTGPDSEKAYRLFANGRKIASGTDLSFLLGVFQSNAMIHVADHASEFVFVHAGVVVHNGRALLFPGTSFAGKSTLIASLVRAGAVYYSDEYALLDADGLVHPYARNLQMRKPGGRQQRSVPVEEFQGVAGTKPVPVSRIYFSRYDAKAAWKPISLAPGLAALQMLTHTIPIRRTPSRVLKTLAAVTAGASSWQSQRGDADTTAKAILSEL